MLTLGRFVALIVFGLCVTCGSIAGECPSHASNLKIDVKAYERMQQFVNEGHEPWRLDSQAVAAEQVLKEEKTPKEQWNVYTLPLEPIEETQQRAIYKHDSRLHPGVSYRVTVERPAWLLSSAKKWEWMIWIPTEIVATHCTLATSSGR